MTVRTTNDALGGTLLQRLRRHFGRDERTRKPLLTRVLHWSTVVLFLVAVVTGYTAFDFSIKMPIRTRDTIFGVHRLTGMAAGLLMLIWLLSVSVQFVRSRTFVGRFSWIGIYHVIVGLTFVIVPAIPWIARSLDGRTSELYDFWPAFNLVSPPTTPWAYWLFHQHKQGVTLIFFLLALHLAGVLFHRFALKDNLLWSMLFDLRKG
jgi:cytochrome b561